ncbi:MAG TPA: AbrB/MazE/SpoVT family DNA-binding domain-containing protein [Candidatus Bathyarchaeia archaeon]|nr:AbrB/MazE/SpoVT family DNA-binding domain-containing protein [Candidatus Bathyarchaeia archaeon]
MPKQQIIKTGNSLAVVVPSEFVNTVGVKAGQAVEVKVSPETGQVIYTFSGAKQLSISNHFKVKINKRQEE